MSDPTPEAVEALDRDLYQHRAAMVMARKDYARAVLTGKVKLSGLFTRAQLDAAVAKVAEAIPDLSHVITWLRNGCDPLKAAEELVIYQERLTAIRKTI